MWILPKQLHTLASVQVMKESDSDSEEFCQMSEKSLMWRSKPSLLRTWRTRLKKGGLTKLLFTRTLKPSHTESFEDEWTSSLEDFPAKDFLMQEIKKVSMTQDTCSHSSPKESQSAGQELFSSKMLKESSAVKPTKENQFSNMSSEHWKKWVIGQRQEYSQRVKSERLIRERESSSLVYPTPRSSDAEGGRVETIVTENGFKSLRKKSNQMFGAKLRDAVETMENWATPRAGATDSTRPNRKGGIPLAQQVKEKNWSTPTAMDSANIQKPRKFHPNGGQKPPLCQEVKDFPTPSANEEKYRLQGNTQASKCLEALARTGQLDQTKSSMNGKNQELLKLNPDWVEQLMGLPTGWTDSDYSEME